MIFKDKIVKFDDYCPRCRYKETPETSDPCNDCLHHPAKEEDRRPVRFWAKAGMGDASDKD